MEYDEYRVVITEPAEADIMDIHTYIAKELNVPTAARNMVLDIRKALRTLSFSPQGFPKVRDNRLAAKGYRWIPVKKYMAFYTIDEPDKIVNVERILYGGRNGQWLL